MIHEPSSSTRSVHTLAVSERRKAGKLALSVLPQARESLADVQQAGFSLDSLVTQYLRAVRLTTTPKTRDLYQLALAGRRGFLEYCHEAGISSPDQLRTRHLQDWVGQHLESGAWKPVTAEGRLRNVSYFLNWLRKEGELDRLPEIPDVSVPEKELQVLDGSEMAALVAAADTERDQLILSILTQTGIRANELCRVELSHVYRQGDRFIMLIQGKGSKERLVQLRPALFRRLSKWLQQGRPKTDSPYLFVSERRDFRVQDYAPLTPSGLRSIVRKAAERAGIRRGVYTHLLRHSFTTEAIRRGADTKAITDALGHSTDRMLRKHYAHTSTIDSWDRLMAAMAPDQLPDSFSSTTRSQRRMARVM